jgi:hypothetical protein
LRRLERHQQTLLPATPQAELHFAPEPEAPPHNEHQELIARLAALDLDGVSPRAALELLYDLARLAKH